MDKKRFEAGTNRSFVINLRSKRLKINIGIRTYFFEIRIEVRTLAFPKTLGTMWQ